MLARIAVDRLHSLRGEIKVLEAEADLIAASVRSQMERGNLRVAEGYQAVASLDLRIIETVRPVPFVKLAGGLVLAEPALSVSVVKARQVIGPDLIAQIIDDTKVVSVLRTAAVAESHLHVGGRR